MNRDEIDTLLKHYEAYIESLLDNGELTVYTSRSRLPSFSFLSVHLVSPVLLEPIRAESRVLSPVNPLSVSPLLPPNPRTIDSGPGSWAGGRGWSWRRTTCTVVVPFFFTYVQPGLSRIVSAV